MKGNPAKLKKRKGSKGTVAAEPLSIPPSTNIKEFPNESYLLFQANYFALLAGKT